MSFPKVGPRAALAAALLLACAGSVRDATAVPETRTLSFLHAHSKETLTVTFKRNGRYDDEGLKKLNWFLRDWRSQDQTKMEPQLFDILWEVYQDVGGKEPIQIISAYRAPKTNSMLRRRSSGVARDSLHMRGMAIDFFIPDVSLEQIRYAGLKLQRGGVGFYPTSGSPFVHLDVGNVRAWPRLSREQLVKLFPDGRTVHLPKDGTPLAGYALAQADIERRKSDDDVSAPSAGTLLASLFGKQGGAPDAVPAVAPPSRPAATAVAFRSEETIPETIPMPRARPQATWQVASAGPPRTVPMPQAHPQTRQIALIARTPADIINSRGFWDDTPSDGNDDARRALVLAAADRAATASVSQAAVSQIPQTASRASIFQVSHFQVSHFQVSQAMAYAAPARPAQRVPGRGGSLHAGGPALMQQASLSVSPNARAQETSPGRKPWTRAIMLAPNAHNYLTATTLGGADMMGLLAQMEKPRRSVIMTFSADPQGGMVTGRFSGAALAQLPTLDFGPRNLAARATGFTSR